jgi:radical SAM protein with 4Fe4S-binding SPASM domain
MYSPFRHITSVFRKSRPIHLTFFVTRRCNSSCPFCFYLKNTDNMASRKKELSIDEIRKVSSSFGDLLWLAFSGGEIFLREDLVEISRIFYDQNKPAIMLFPTNGLLPELIRDRTEQILRHCSNSVVTVKLSIDGLNEDHDILRNTPGSFEKTIQTYNLLGAFLEKYPNFELGVNTVFCSENQDRIDNIIDFVSGLKNIKTHTISLVRGNLSDESFKKVDFRKYNNAIENLEKNLKNRTSSTYRFRGARIKAAQDILQRKMIHRTSEEKKRLIPCYAGKLNLVLSENGDVFPCEILTESMGNIREHEYDINKILDSDKASVVLKGIKNKQCFCTHECYFMTNILFNPALYPALFKEYIQL